MHTLISFQHFSQFRPLLLITIRAESLDKELKTIFSHTSGCPNLCYYYNLLHFFCVYSQYPFLILFNLYRVGSLSVAESQFNDKFANQKLIIYSSSYFAMNMF